MVEDLVVTSSLSSVEDLVGTSSLSSVEDTQAALARAERRWPSLRWPSLRWPSLLIIVGKIVVGEVSLRLFQHGLAKQI
jgi:flavin-binding protein dodecin